MYPADAIPVPPSETPPSVQLVPAPLLVTPPVATVFQAM